MQTIRFVELDIEVGEYSDVVSAKDDLRNNGWKLVGENKWKKDGLQITATICPVRVRCLACRLSEV